MRLIFISLMMIPALVSAQSTRHVKATRNSAPYYLRLFSQSGGKPASPDQDVLAFIRKLEAKRYSFKHEKDFLHHLFVKTRQQFLITFKPYGTFSDLIDHGSYNCLTATSLYAIILEHFNFEHEVVETSEHIFIICRTANGPVLLESTDPDHGFIDTWTGVEKRWSEYQRQNMRTRSSSVYLYSGTMMDSVSMTGLLGLLHYNHAAKAYNEKNYPAAIAHLHHAFLLHRSERMEEFAAVMMLTIQHTRMMDPRVKDDLIGKILALKRLRSDNISLKGS